ncbi:hypothetical protein AALB53_14890 [Lachnospiraceae bacterium 47-T17]
MKNNKKQLHARGYITCILVASALTVLTSPVKVCPAATAHAAPCGLSPFVSGTTAVLSGKAADAASETSGLHTGRGIINKIELSLEDAVALAQKAASRYYDGLYLTHVYSYDNDRTPQMSSGSDGRREWWYVNFANEKKNFVSVLICGGEIVNAVHFDENLNNGLFDLSDVKLTAKQAAQKARALGLRGGDPANGDEWVSGFNFKLSYASLAVSPDDVRLFFEVIGISPNGNFAHVDFDAVTGEPLLAEEKLEYANGDVVWRKF